MQIESAAAFKQACADSSLPPDELQALNAACARLAPQPKAKNITEDGAIISSLPHIQAVPVGPAFGSSTVGFGTSNPAVEAVFGDCSGSAFGRPVVEAARGRSTMTFVFGKSTVLMQSEVIRGTGPPPLEAQPGIVTAHPRPSPSPPLPPTHHTPNITTTTGSLIPTDAVSNPFHASASASFVTCIAACVVDPMTGEATTIKQNLDAKMSEGAPNLNASASSTVNAAESVGTKTMVIDQSPDGKLPFAASNISATSAANQALDNKMRAAFVRTKRKLTEEGGWEDSSSDMELDRSVQLQLATNLCGQHY